MINKYNKFQQFMLEYTEFFEKTAELEEEKFKALYSREPERIDSALKQQVLTERQTLDLEQQRITMQDELGFGEKKFSEIISDFAEEFGANSPEQKTLHDIFQRLRIAVDKTKLFNGKSLEFAQINLDIIAEISGGDVTDSSTYGAKGEQKDPSKPSFFNKSV
jgi:hypothetical protein